jgi:N-acetylmuramoyl-L-alanine amidase
MLVALSALLALAPVPVICIDPGHPSEVGRGTRGKQVTEMQVAWQTAVALRARLQKEGYRVVLTKKNLEEKVVNKRRAEIANASKANLMVRLHCDAASGSGFTVYYPTVQGKSKGFTGPSQDVLERSSVAAAKFHAAMARSLKGKLKDNGLKSDLKTNVGSKQGALTGSIFSKVPVLLVEMVVLTNPKDEAFIRSAKGKAKMTNAILAGIRAACPLTPAQDQQALWTP